MTRITVDRDPSYAPSSYLLCRVDENGEWNTRDDENTILVQLDYDFCGIASSFGWEPCECGSTDGTIDCEHKTASQMIGEATEYLDDHIGTVIEDNSYYFP